VKKTYPLPKELQLHGIEIYLMSKEKIAIWMENVKKIHPDFPFNQQTLRSCGMDYSHPDLPPMFKGQQNTHPKYKND